MNGRDVCLSHCKPCRIEYGRANFCHICDLATTPGELFVVSKAYSRALAALSLPCRRALDLLTAALEKLRRVFARTRPPVFGIDPGAPDGDFSAFRRFTTEEIATFFRVPRELLSAPAAAVPIMPRRAGKARIAAFYSTYRRSYAYRVMREMGALGKRVNAPSGKVRPSVTRHMLKLQRYAYRAMSGRG
jgi:hypothetical protein